MHSASATSRLNAAFEKVSRPSVPGFHLLRARATLNILPPYIGYPLELVQSSWTIAFYCFDYRWTLGGLTLEERMRKFETHWPFMLGFGAPLAAFSLWLPVYWGYVAYALFFPVCMILAIETDPILHQVTARFGLIDVIQYY